MNCWFSSAARLAAYAGLTFLLVSCSGSSQTSDDSGGVGANDTTGTTPDGGPGDETISTDTRVPADTPGEDVAVAPVDVPAGGPDVARRDTSGLPRPCDPCGYGSVRGRVCAPNEQVFVNGASVWVETMACDGSPVRIEAVSDASGYYLLENVPCGEQTIEIQKGSYEHRFEVTIRAAELNDITGMGFKLCFSPTSAGIAVITGDWDNIEHLIWQLGLEADTYELYGGFGDDQDWYSGQAVDFLSDLGAMQQYDIILVDCGDAHSEVASSSPAVDQNIRAFVEGGGSLYMSDWAYIYSERVWPEAIDFYGANETGSDPIVLTSAELTGIILDTDMQAYLAGATSLPIDLGLSPLVSVEGAAGTSTIHVVAQIPQFNNVNQPLILSYRPTATSGRVIYTTFHNEEQHMELMQKVLTYLMFVL